MLLVRFSYIVITHSSFEVKMSQQGLPLNLFRLTKATETDTDTIKFCKEIGLFPGDISPIGEKVMTKVLKNMVLIEIFLINVMTKVSKRTEMPKCKKRKLFGMSQQCKTPSKVAHVIRTLSYCSRPISNN